MPKKNIKESTPPAALMQYLKDYPQIADIDPHLDNDALLPFTYTITNEPPQRGKDYNHHLRITLGIRRPQEIEGF